MLHLLLAIVGALGASPGYEWRSSCFVFRDVNRNGVYDLGDRPFAGLLLQMHRPDGTMRESTSNIAGFGNFDMVAGDPARGHIYEPGSYRVRAELPLGWSATNPKVLEQELVFEAFDRAGSGMVPTAPCEHIGIAQELLVSGRIDAPDTSRIEDIEITAAPDGGAPIEVPFDGAGHFRFQASPGVWRISVRDKALAVEAIRTVELGDYSIAVSMITIGETKRVMPSTRTQDVAFDDLLSSDALLEIPSGYRGLDWRYWVATHERFYGGPGYVNGTVSGEYMAYNSSGLPASIARSAPFAFHGVHMTAAWPDGEQDDVVVRGWLDGKLVFEDPVAIDTTGPVYFQADYPKVDRVEFSHNIYERIVIDDLRYGDF